MFYFRKIRSKKLFVLLICFLAVLFVKLEYDKTNSQGLNTSSRKRISTTPKATTTQKVYHFPHFLKNVKNPCYLETYEPELFDGLVNTKSIPTTNTSAHSFALVEFEINGTGVTDNLRCLPYYFVLGWPKCGTSDLYAKMMVHPNILRQSDKEPMWFNTIRFDVNEDRAVQILTHDLNKKATEHIARHLNANQTPYVKDIIGDHSTHTIDMWSGHNNTYNYHLKYSFGIPEANTYASPLVTYSNARLMERLIPDAKFIVVMRDPVERFYSLYRMHEATSAMDFHNGVVNGINWWRSCEKENVPLGECLYTNPKLDTFTAINCTWNSRAITSARRSIYHLYLTEWLQVFPRQQFLFIQFEDYMANDIDIINNLVFPFLGLTNMDKKGLSKMRKTKIRHFISFRKNSAGKNINPHYRSPMLDKTRDLLRDFYRPYNVKLATLLNDTRYLWGY